MSKSLQQYITVCEKILATTYMVAIAGWMWITSSDLNCILLCIATVYKEEKVKSGEICKQFKLTLACQVYPDICLPIRPNLTIGGECCRVR